MPSPFAAVIKVAAATHDRIMGEGFAYHPYAYAGGAAADVNKRRLVDTSRTIVTGLRLPFGAPAARAMSGPVRTPGVKPEHPGIASDRPFVSLQLSLLPYAPTKGDRLLHVDSGAWFSVAEILPSTTGFVRLDLNEMSAGA